MVTHKQTIQVGGKSVRITIPAGIENGQMIRLKGYGAPGAAGGPAGNDLFTAATIDLYTALLGGEVTVDTMSGKVKLKVAPETQYGTEVRLKGKGMPVYKKDGETGDLYVSYQVKLPTNLTEEQKKLFTELSKLQ